ncbi:hypothetical protein [Streptomyces sp. NBC_00203]|uniref:hypothetical protein n=1 Tax=Streptomyces sp. NBC_00203 TaxID=2975680 RepID=UPI00324670A6
MFDFGIAGYGPRWMNGASAVKAAHGERLRALTGRPLTRVWAVWDLHDGEWFADCPVLLDFGGEQVEVNHWKFDDLSLTWNSIDPQRPVKWPGFALRWQRDPFPGTRALLDQPLQDVELLEWTGPDVAQGAVDVSFVFPQGRVTVFNALDENGLSFDPRDS